MSRTRWTLYAVGAGMAAYGLLGLVLGARSNPVAWLRFAAVVSIVNDGVLAPFVLLGGVLVTRVVPPRHRPKIQIGLFITGAVTLVALPLVLGYGRTADNPSALPLPYGRGLLIVLSLVWVVLGLAVLAGRFIGPGRRPSSPCPRVRGCGNAAGSGRRSR